MDSTVNTYIINPTNYGDEETKLRHFCQVCNTPLKKNELFWYLKHNESIYNRWACSESCATLLCLANGVTNYPGYSYEQDSHNSPFS